MPKQLNWSTFNPQLKLLENFVVRTKRVWTRFQPLQTFQNQRHSLIEYINNGPFRSPPQFISVIHLAISLQRINLRIPIFLGKLWIFAIQRHLHVFKKNRSENCSKNRYKMLASHISSTLIIRNVHIYSIQVIKNTWVIYEL